MTTVNIDQVAALTNISQSTKISDQKAINNKIEQIADSSRVRKSFKHHAPERQPFEHKVADEFFPKFTQYSDQIIETNQVRVLYDNLEHAGVGSKGREMLVDQSN